MPVPCPYESWKQFSTQSAGNDSPVLKLTVRGTRAGSYRNFVVKGGPGPVLNGIGSLAQQGISGRGCYGDLLTLVSTLAQNGTAQHER
jgi:hypothetical protein